MTGWEFERLDLPHDTPLQIIERVGVTRWFGPVLSVKPVIVCVAWNDGRGHAVLIDTVLTFFGRKYATVCDPADANVHVIPLEENIFDGVAYTGAKPAVGVNFWGRPLKAPYPREGRLGSFTGGIFFRPEWTASGNALGSFPRNSVIADRKPWRSAGR